MQLGWTGMLTHPQQIAGSMFLATVLQHVASNRIIFTYLILIPISCAFLGLCSQLAI